MLEHSEMLGTGLMVLTSECDRWTSARGRARDRLDVLALDTDGHLVVAELKRDEAPETVELQALKYAAYCSRFTPESLVEEYRAWRARHDEVLSDDEAFARLVAHLGEDVGGLAGAPLDQPRIVLLAGGFTPSTTAVAVWLREMGVDITLRSAISAYQNDGGPVVSVAAAIPHRRSRSSPCRRCWPSASAPRTCAERPGRSRRYANGSPVAPWSPAPG